MIKRTLSVVIALYFVVFSYAGLIPEELQEVAQEIREVCVEESGVNRELIDKAGAGEFTEDDKLKCYLKCTLKQFGLISRKNKINWDTLIRVAPPSLKDVAAKLSETCKHIMAKDNDQCDLAYNHMKCAYEHFPDAFFII